MLIWFESPELFGSRRWAGRGWKSNLAFAAVQLDSRLCGVTERHRDRWARGSLQPGCPRTWVRAWPPPEPLSAWGRGGRETTGRGSTDVAGSSCRARPWRLSLERGGRGVPRPGTHAPQAAPGERKLIPPGLNSRTPPGTGKGTPAGGAACSRRPKQPRGHPGPLPPA